MNEAVSVIIPCYNTHKYIVKCVESIRNQSYKNIELIVVDDGSNQETKNKLKALSSQIDVLMHQENKGQSSARNLGLKKASGKYIIFIDSDDYVEPDFCEKLLRNYNTNYSVVTCFANVFSGDNNSTVFKPIGGGLDKSLLNNTALGTSLFVKQELLNINGYDESMRSGFEDWEMLIRLLAYTNKEVFVINLPLYNYRKGIESTTTIANKNKYELLNYMYLKHKDLYINNYDLFVSHLLNALKREEKEKIKNTQRIEYIFGKALLTPLRFIKALFK